MRLLRLILKFGRHRHNQGRKEKQDEFVNYMMSFNQPDLAMCGKRMAELISKGKV